MGGVNICEYAEIISQSPRANEIYSLAAVDSDFCTCMHLKCMTSMRG